MHRASLFESVKKKLKSRNEYRYDQMFMSVLISVFKQFDSECAKIYIKSKETSYTIAGTRNKSLLDLYMIIKNSSMFKEIMQSENHTTLIL